MVDLAMKKINVGLSKWRQHTSKRDQLDFYTTFYGVITVQSTDNFSRWACKHLCIWDRLFWKWRESIFRRKFRERKIYITYALHKLWRLRTIAQIRRNDKCRNWTYITFRVNRPIFYFSDSSRPDCQGCRKPNLHRR